MAEQNHQAEPESSRVAAVPLPVALYISNGLIFEVYDGGQSLRRFSISWDRLIPANGN